MAVDVNPTGLIALAIVLLPVIAMLIDMVFHQQLLKRLRKEASKRKGE